MVYFPADPTRTGYNFAGWNTGANGSGTAFTASTTVSADITVYAQWTVALPGSYTVTFKLNDGTETFHASKTVTLPATTIGAADFPANPSRTGYNFGGWNTGGNGSGYAFTASTPVYHDITVYAQWTVALPGSYTVTFVMNDGTETVHSVKTVAPPATTIGTDNFPADPTRTGYIFGGWNYYSQGTAFTDSTTVNHDITVYAKWDNYTYTVSFDKNGGNTEASPATRTVNSPSTTINTLPTPPTRSGYIFGGWYTAQDDGGSEFTASTTVSGNITVYARWIYSYTVTFNKNGGDTEAYPATKTVIGPATTIDTLPAPPAKTGYNFGGWYTAPGSGGSEFTETTTVSGNITVHAHWDTYSYTVTFNKNDGDTEAYPATKTVNSPATTIDTLPAPPTRTNYNFDAWNTAPDGTGTLLISSTTVSGDITVYAQWAYTQFDITVNLGDAGDGAFSETDFTLSKSGTGNPDSRTISITGTDYTNPRWMVDGTLKGTGTGIIIQAADYGTGGHGLTLIVTRSGISWSKEIAFTVTN
jgi:uncharacterized repeat protein (TIGR02543 family)